MKTPRKVISFLLTLLLVLSGCPYDHPTINDGSYDVVVDSDAAFGYGTGVDCSEHLGMHLCLRRVNTNSVEIGSNAYTWLSWPQTLYVAVVYVNGCEEQREWKTVFIHRQDWPHLHFGTLVNGMQLVETTYQTIPVNCTILPTSNVSVELYSVRGDFPRQELVVQRFSREN
jgi:hypothetical protein